MTKRWIPVALLLALAVPAAAQPCPQRTPAPEAAAPAPAEVTTGKTLFQKGLALQGRGKIEEACKVFESSMLLDPQIGTRLNVAECRELRGNAVEAYLLFKETAAEAERTGDRRLAFANQRIAALELKLVRVTLKLPEAAAGAAIKIAGCAASPAELAAPYVVAPGPLVVEVVAPGFKPYRAEQATEAGTEVTVEISALEPYANLEEERKAKEAERKAKEAEALAAVERRKAAEIDERRYDRHPARTWMLVTGGIGAAAVIAGTYFLIDARRAQSSFDDAGCGDRTQLLDVDEYASCTELRDRGDRSTLFGRSFLIGGGVVVAVSALVFVLDPGNVERPRQPMVTVTGRSVGVTVRW